MSWSFKQARTEFSYPPGSRAGVLDGFASFHAPILAVIVADDELGTQAAVRRTLAYYSGTTKAEVLLTPEDLGASSIGHFGLFHARFAGSFWTQSLEWLRDGVNPWPHPNP